MCQLIKLEIGRDQCKTIVFYERYQIIIIAVFVYQLIKLEGVKVYSEYIIV